jgi:histidyl-tRNA synthetase
MGWKIPPRQSPKVYVTKAKPQGLCYNFPMEKNNTKIKTNAKTELQTRLSTSPYKGTSDTYPEDMYSRKYLFKIWEDVARTFGYEEYDTPLLEESLLYKAKSGDELADNQLYNFTDKGEREVAIRPEMTPSLARIIAARRKELQFPLRWFNIGRFYRYEKPQRGRSREFFQLNIDIIGMPTIEAEIEMIEFVMQVMAKLQAPKETYELKVNNRYLLDYLFEKILQIDDPLKSKITKAIDNYLKIDSKEFNGYLLELGLDNQKADKLEDFLKWDITNLEEIKDVSKGADELLQLFSKIKALGISNVKFCPYIVRGLDYYTGTVIEMFDVGSKENPRALFGGGRYDNLLEIFGEKSIPAFGLGWGNITTLDYLKTYNLLPEYKTSAKVFVTLMDESLYEETSKIVKILRKEGINTQMQLTPIKLGKQLKYANRNSIPWVIILGENELKEEKVLLKNMKTSEQETLTMEEVLEKLSI